MNYAPCAGWVSADEAWGRGGKQVTRCLARAPLSASRPYCSRHNPETDAAALAAARLEVEAAAASARRKDGDR